MILNYSASRITDVLRGELKERRVHNRLRDDLCINWAFELYESGVKTPVLICTMLVFCDLHTQSRNLSTRVVYQVDLLPKRYNRSQPRKSWVRKAHPLAFVLWARLCTPIVICLLFFFLFLLVNYFLVINSSLFYITVTMNTALPNLQSLYSKMNKSTRLSSAWSCTSSLCRQDRSSRVLFEGWNCNCHCHLLTRMEFSGSLPAQRLARALSSLSSSKQAIWLLLSH